MSALAKRYNVRLGLEWQRRLLGHVEDRGNAARGEHVIVSGIVLVTEVEAGQHFDGTRGIHATSML